MLFGNKASCTNIVQLQISFWPTIKLLEFIWPESKVQFAYCPGIGASKTKHISICIAYEIQDICSLFL